MLSEEEFGEDAPMLANFIRAHYDIDKFVREEFQLERKKKKKNDDDEDDEDLMDIAQKEFNCSAHKVWKKKLKEIEKEIKKKERAIENQEKKVEKEEEKVEKEEEKKGKANKKKLEKT